MNMLELLKYVSELSVFDTTVFECEEEDYNISFNNGSLYWFAGGDPDPKELRTHEILSLIEENIIFSIAK